MPIRILALCLCTQVAVIAVGAKDADVTAQATGPSAATSSEHVVQLRGQKVDVQALRSKAKALRSKAGKKPGSKEAQEAEVEETEVLIKLAHTKDQELAARRRELVEKLKRDESVSKATRFRLTGSSANIEVAINRSLDPDQRMAAYAEVAWQLVRDFPDNPEGYASLLRIARDSNHTQAAKIAEALLLSNAPEAIKEAALEIRERTKLVGQSLRQVFGDEFVIPIGQRPICIYAWSVRQPVSLAIAKTMKDNMPDGTVFVGICLDGDTEEARILALKEAVPAQLVFPVGGMESTLCHRLFLKEPSVYLAAADGLIATVSGRNQIEVARWQKAKGGRK